MWLQLDPNKRPRQPIGPRERFGRLLTVEDVGNSNDGHRIWRCRCDCGKEVQRTTNNLRTKALASCGCAQRDLQKTHGLRKTAEWNSWQGAKQRCLNPSTKDYPNYGGRGIQMCKSWCDSFEAFLLDMGPQPEPGMSIERKDNNGHYEPSNCVWATTTQQSRNRRTSIYVEWGGQRVHLKDVADSLSITYGAAFMRLKRGKLHAQTT